MKQLKTMYFEACLEDAQKLVNHAMYVKDWTVKSVTLKRAGQSIRMAGKILNEIYEQERRCKNGKVLENNRVN